MKTFAKRGLVAGAFSAVLCTGIFIGQAIAVQPHMQNALSSLETAQRELGLSASNKAGHRVSAMRYTNLAIAQTRAGIAAGE